MTLRILGRVQGVGFRYSASAEATRWGLTGWVRNTTDGSVELVAEGEDVKLRELLQWCRRGPRGAVVSRIDETWGAATGEFVDFAIYRTNLGA